MSVMIEHTGILTHVEAEHLDCAYCGREACPDECAGVQLVDDCPATQTACDDCHRDLCRSAECAGDEE